MIDAPTLRVWIDELIESREIVLLREILATEPEVSRQAINAQIKKRPSICSRNEEHLDAEVFNLLLEAGLDVSQDTWSGDSGEPLLKLLQDAGAPSSRISAGQRPELCGVSRAAVTSGFGCTSEQFLQHRHREFGSSNPQTMNHPFWLEMVRGRHSAYHAREHFSKLQAVGGAKTKRPDLSQGKATNKPVWCARRYGQSFTYLDDGRVVEVGGEHEDWYDPDFCIYNDVIVHERGGASRIYGYPQTVFPPTDFHSATLIGQSLYLIGSLGYKDARQLDDEQVFVLDLRSFSMRRLATKGPGPGWIHGHAARALSTTEILVWGGIRINRDHQSVPLESHERYVLDIATRRWRSL